MQEQESSSREMQLEIPMGLLAHLHPLLGCLVASFSGPALSTLHSPLCTLLVLRYLCFHQKSRRTIKMRAALDSRLRAQRCRRACTQRKMQIEIWIQLQVQIQIQIQMQVYWSEETTGRQTATAAAPAPAAAAGSALTSYLSNRYL